MTHEEIIAMAKEAGFDMSRLPSIRAANVYGEVNDELARFAALVAAKEREACLSECNELLKVSARQATDGDHFEIGRESGHTECIEAILARGQKEGV